jgi:hypothetical protein
VSDLFIHAARPKTTGTQAGAAHSHQVTLNRGPLLGLYRWDPTGSVLCLDVACAASADARPQKGCRNHFFHRH